MSKPAIERFEEKYMPEPNSGCWLWTACVDTNQYGRFMVNGKSRKAHRWAYEHFVGPIPEELAIDHLCRVRCCVNPDHLEAVTHRENVRRGEGGLYNKKKTHCLRGHPFSDENTTLYRGSRTCRTCRNARCRKYKARKKIANRILQWIT